MTHSSPLPEAIRESIVNSPPTWLPNVRMRRTQVLYDANDVAAIYVFAHWVSDYNRWRTRPYCRPLSTAQPIYAGEAVRSYMRRILGIWYLGLPYEKDMDVGIDVLNNTFTDPVNYTEWANANTDIDSISKVPRNSMVLMLLPAHKQLLRDSPNGKFHKCFHSAPAQSSWHADVTENVAATE